MRVFLTTLGFLFTLFVCSQPNPIHWEVKSELIKPYHYSISVKGKIEPGWHVYASTDTAIGIEAITIQYENADVSKDNSPGVTEKDGQAPLNFKDPLFEGKWVKIYRNNVYLHEEIKIVGSAPTILKMVLTGFAGKKGEFWPIEERVEAKLENGTAAIRTLKIPTIDISRPEADCGNKQQKSKGIPAIFLIGFGGGLIALVTPCIFPLIPLTVSVFANKAKTKQQGVRNGAFYGICIFLIYSLASAPFHLIGNVNPQIFNVVASNAWVNLLFFIIFIVFSLSFFGLFEIKLPSALSNNVGNKSGIFFMALTLVIVSFSCTGVILGSLLVNALSTDGNVWQLTSGMAGFGLALALPFGLFAMFPAWLQKLPKSGNWLGVVKKSLAFVELALALKFLSNADLVAHWGLLKREVFIGIWIVIAAALSLYLMGMFERNHITLKFSIKKVIGFSILLFAIYLVPGLTKSKQANLKLVSGFPPPISYSIYGKENIRGKGIEPDVINDYDAALQMARESGKPLLIDFTGWACVNCRKMEEKVWSHPSIMELIKDNFILVSLYVDDRKKLPADKRFVENGLGKEIITVGDKWATFQAENFKQVTQPLYVTISPDEVLLNSPAGYTPNSTQFKQWLECGINANKRRKSLAINNTRMRPLSKNVIVTE